MKKIIILFIAFLIISPNFASASTINNLQEQIRSLLAQIASLQQQLSQQVGQSEQKIYTNTNRNTCLSLTNNLSYRSRDSWTNGEVSTLQDFLQVKGYLSSEPTGYFGLLTLEAVKKFQIANGISPVQGFVGVLTRAKLNSMNSCAKTTTKTSPISTSNQIHTLSILYPTHNASFIGTGPSTVTWTDGDANGKYAIKVTVINSVGYSSGTKVFSTTLTREQSGCSASDKCSYSLSVKIAGTYRLSVKNQTNGVSDTVNFTIQANTISQVPSITILSPSPMGVKGGLDIDPGSNYTIRWTSTELNKVKPYLCTYSGSCKILGNVPNVGVNTYLGSFNWYVDPNHPYFPGYNLRIKLEDASNSKVFAYSGYFDVIPIIDIAPQILYPKGGEILQGNITNFISWNPISYSETFDVSIIGIDSGNSYLIIQNVPAKATDKQSIQWTPKTGMYEKDTRFMAQVCRTGTTLCSKSNGFTINFPNTSQTQPSNGNFSISRSSFDFKYTQGEKTPPLQDLTFTNTSNTKITYTLKVDNKPNWLNTSYNTDSATVWPGTVTGLHALVDPVGLAPGNYKTTLSINGNFTNSPISIPITLSVVSKPTTSNVTPPTNLTGSCPAPYTKANVSWVASGYSPYYVRMNPGAYNYTWPLSSGGIVNQVTNTNWSFPTTPGKHYTWWLTVVDPKTGTMTDRVVYDLSCGTPPTATTLNSNQMANVLMSVSAILKNILKSLR